ncbi:unnamed protein product [Echinostoma caproni]|uniref:Heat shock 70 kDa protein 14 n=1 Tax=Echinostoma caproni TaxID=27848 RepID=A0A183B1A3_9TREM|nr:unnamed protein product [Echinostoma caproni]
MQFTLQDISRYDSLPVGLDIGTLNSSISVYRNHEFRTIEDDTGKKRIHTCVAFQSNRRMCGSLAWSYQSDSYETCYFDFKRFIGQRLSSEDDAANIIAKLPYTVRYERENGNLQFSVVISGNRIWVTAEQLMIMYLKHLQSLIVQNAHKDNLLCVLGVPVSYTKCQRDALLSACKVANLNAELLDETIAIATGFALSQPQIHVGSSFDRQVALISIGYMHTQVAICEFKPQFVRILATSSDPDLGGFHFDRILCDLICEAVKRTHPDKYAQIESRRLLVHIMAALDDVKKCLSRDDWQISVRITDLFQVESAIVELTRFSIQTKCTNLLNRLKETILICLRAPGVCSDRIDSVQLIGGTCRMREIVDTVKHAFGKKINTSFQGDDLVANGCAYHAAAKTGSFQTSITVLESAGALSEEQIQHYRSVESQITQLDELEKAAQERVNALEESTYIAEDVAQPGALPYVFDHELKEYRESVEKIRTDIWLKGFDRSIQECNRVKRELSEMEQKIRHMSEVRQRLIAFLLKVSICIDCNTDRKVHVTQFNDHLYKVLSAVLLNTEVWLFHSRWGETVANILTTYTVIKTGLGIV